MANVNDSIIQNPDGTVNDLSTGEVFASTADFVAQAGSDDISMASQGTNPPVTAGGRVPDAGTNAATSFLNAAGSFGVAIASLVTGRAVAVTATGQPVGTANSRQINRPVTSSLSPLGTLILLGFGLLILVKVLK